ncbi:FecR family protein [Pedobacter mendelii]|uniref:Iron dicitrate transporter FecR n=1 Tax=Pedobacter mendelii TaxID=1908240 RepID=A0ABQ2BNV2_9SPHI|nr:FecR family protein [Pedobacter mendelii]GGI28657.1 iron dicitrate transporter FecR [Pedobacter mendelii]
MEEDFLKLYEKVQSGKCTPGEIELLENYKDRFILKNYDWTAEMGDREQVFEELHNRLKQETLIPLRARKLKLMIRWGVAASIMLVAGLSVAYFNIGSILSPGHTISVAKLKFETRNGEKKRIVLPDGTVVILNVKSSLTLYNDFGQNNRAVTIVGEALFDVVHKKNKPFKVHTKDFNINVLGTLFNIKAYANDKTSEATLLRGLISMQSTQNLQKIIMLKPSQKVTFSNIGQFDYTAKRKNTAPKITIDTYTELPDSIIVETAWTKNRLEIQDQDLKGIANLLERTFDVNIIINDAAVEGYKYTATFTTETIFDVLNTLKKSKHFNYQMRGGTIIITK